jgi:hypothetical protein
LEALYLLKQKGWSRAEIKKLSPMELDQLLEIDIFYRLIKKVQEIEILALENALYQADSKSSGKISKAIKKRITTYLLGFDEKEEIKQTKNGFLEAPDLPDGYRFGDVEDSREIAGDLAQIFKD